MTVPAREGLVLRMVDQFADVSVEPTVWAEDEFDIEPMMAESASCWAVGGVAAVAVLPEVPVEAVVPSVPVPVAPVPVVVPLSPVAAVPPSALLVSAPAWIREFSKPLGEYTDTPDVDPPSEATMADCDAKLVASDDKAPDDVFGTTSGLG